MKHSRESSNTDIFIICKLGFAVAVFLFLATTLLASVNAYALNDDYLDESKWSDSANVSSVVLNKKSNDNSLSGVFKYYIDNGNGNLYLYFSITESSLNANNNDVRINIYSESESESYTFSVDKDGICDALNEEEKLFEVHQSFEYYSATDSGLYITGIHPDIREQLIIDISLYINGHKYIIADSLELQPPAESTTLKSAQNTTAKSAKTTAKSNSNDKTDKSEAADKMSTAAGTTKFSGTPVPTQQQSQTQAALYEDSDEGSADYNSTENQSATAESADKAKVTLSKTAKICLYSGSAAAAAGLIFLVLSVIAHVKEKDDIKA